MRDKTTESKTALMPIGKRLMEKGFLDEKQLEQALQYQQKSGGDLRLGETLVKLGFITEHQLLECIGEQFDVPVVDLKKAKISAEAVEAVPRNTAKMHNVMPIELQDGALVIALDTLDVTTIDNLRFILDKEIKPVLALSEDIADALERYYGGQESTVESMLSEITASASSEWLGREGSTELSELSEYSELSEAVFMEGSGWESSKGDEMDAPTRAAVVRLVSLFVSEAVRARASDVHVEPLGKRLRVRYRVDGSCHEVESPPKHLQRAIIARLKVMSGMDVAEKRKPQEGRIFMKTAGRDIDLRVSDIPTTNGESIVLRILDKAMVKIKVTELGFHESDMRRFEKIITRPNGIFLVTGPTGSGKTTTLYAALNELNRPDVKILTAEDPVEYHMSGINQSQVEAEIGRTFAVLLRAMMRQAPEIILIGEIRDPETAGIAIRAALTGHLVFSTLHTNDAPSAIPRLIDLGSKPYLVSSSVLAVMAQRLVRRICEECKEPYQYPEHLIKAMGLQPEDVAGLTLYHGAGCKACEGTGYFDRVAVFELMEMSPELRALAYNKATASEIRAKARALGMLTLMEDGLRKVMQGVTTIEEIISVAGTVQDLV